MRFTKVTRLSREDLGVLRGALRLYLDETQANYFPGQPGEGTTRLRLERAARLLAKVARVEDALEALEA